jgi:hypothetical protein
MGGCGMPAEAGACRLYNKSDVAFGLKGQLYGSPRHRLGNLIM